MATSSRIAATSSLLEYVLQNRNACPCHSNGASYMPTLNSTWVSHGHHMQQHAHVSTTQTNKEYAFELASSTIRFGRGVVSEVGMDLRNMNIKKVMIISDENVSQLPVLQKVLDSIASLNSSTSGAASRPHIQITNIFTDVEIEPTDASLERAILAAKQSKPDAFLAVGGGSVMDTTKAAMLYSSFPDRGFLDFVNTPIGKGDPVPSVGTRPVICVPTTAGTGSETTGTVIFDYKPLSAKTGIGSKNIRPTLGLIDPDSMQTMPEGVAIASGFDVLCHAIESYTAIPYSERPRPSDPAFRPSYQGCNPISDIWALHALRMVSESFIPSVKDPGNNKAREHMVLAATIAGIGFGSAGVHIPHGVSYAISGLNKVKPHVQYSFRGYKNKVLIPHGVSVVLTAPSVFEFTAHVTPERHAVALEALNPAVKLTEAQRKDGAYVGAKLRESILSFMHQLEVPLGLSHVGYKASDLKDLVDGSFVQKRVINLAPLALQESMLSEIITNAYAY